MVPQNPAQKRLERLANQYGAVEREIVKELKKLPKHGRRCTCDEPEVVRVAEGFDRKDGPTVGTYCVECGGYLEW